MSTIINPMLNGVSERDAPSNPAGHTCTCADRKKPPCGPSACSDQIQIVDALVLLVDRLGQLNALLSTLSPAKSKRRAASSKTPITRDHETRAKALQAEGRTATEIAEALGISRTSASLLLHDKYPFSVAQQIES
jgi:hypothetical protein